MDVASDFHIGSVARSAEAGVESPRTPASRWIRQAFRNLRAPSSGLKTQNHLLAKIRAYHKLLLGIALLLSALGLGKLADSLSGDSALRSWLTGHPPDSLVWKSALESRGLTAPAKPALLNAALRSLPYSADDEATTWVAEKGLWVAVFVPHGGAQPALVACLRCDVPPGRWEPSGQGWIGFEQVLAWLDPRIAQLKRAAPLKKSQPWQDPREFHY